MRCLYCGKVMKVQSNGTLKCDCGYDGNIGYEDDIVDGDIPVTSKIPDPPTSCDDTAHFSNCTFNPIVGDNPNYGFWQQGDWVCPKCGAVLLPSTSYCPFCALKKNSTVKSDKVHYDTDYIHLGSIFGISSGHYTNPNIGTSISEEK